MTRREMAETLAYERHENRVRQLIGHKLPAWESLSEAMREALVLYELSNLPIDIGKQFQ